MTLRLNAGPLMPFLSVQMNSSAVAVEAVATKYSLKKELVKPKEVGQLSVEFQYLEQSNYRSNRMVEIESFALM